MLAGRGAKLRHRELLALVRHNHDGASLERLLERMQEQGLVRRYLERRQGPRRSRERKMVALTELGSVEAALR